MNAMIRTIPMLNASMACFDRIQKFLNSDARQDHRLQLITSEQTKPLAECGNTADVELREYISTVSGPSRDDAMIVAKNASFSWTADGEPVVRDISFTLARHQFCFIIGPVGSGKSTLLKGLLGETPSLKGFVYSTFPTTAYVDQTPWIQNSTVQQNILGVSTFDEPWYRQVVRACALEQDIVMMPKGHGQCCSRIPFQALMSSSYNRGKRRYIPKRRPKTKTSSCTRSLRQKGARYPRRRVFRPRRRV